MPLAGRTPEPVEIDEVLQHLRRRRRARRSRSNLDGVRQRARRPRAGSERGDRRARAPAAAPRAGDAHDLADPEHRHRAASSARSSSPPPRSRRSPRRRRRCSSTSTRRSAPSPTSPGPSCRRRSRKTPDTLQTTTRDAADDPPVPGQQRAGCSSTCSPAPRRWPRPADTIESALLAGIPGAAGLADAEQRSWRRPRRRCAPSTTTTTSAPASTGSPTSAQLAHPAAALHRPGAVGLQLRDAAVPQRSETASRGQRARHLAACHRRSSTRRARTTRAARHRPRPTAAAPTRATSCTSTRTRTPRRRARPSSARPATRPTPSARQVDRQPARQPGHRHRGPDPGQNPDVEIEEEARLMAIFSATAARRPSQDFNEGIYHRPPTGLSFFKTGVLALILILDPHLLRLHEGAAVGATRATRSTATFDERGDAARDLAGADRRRQRRRGDERRARRRRRRRSPSPSTRRACRCTTDAADHDPAAALPRGQLLPRPAARAARARPSSTTAATIPVTQTATAVQLDEILTSLQQPDRENLSRPARRLRLGARRQADGRRRTWARTPTSRAQSGAEAINESFTYGGRAGKGTAQVNQALLGEQAGRPARADRRDRRRLREARARASRS